MKGRVSLRCFSFAICGLAAAAFIACGDDESGGSGGDGGSGASGGTGSLSTSATTGAGSTTATTGAGSTTATTGTGSPPEDGPLIDDMEDGNNVIAEAGGRVGYWYVFNDETEGGQQVPAAENRFAMTHLDPARGESTTAACSRGSGFEGWGAGFGFDLNVLSSGEKTAYDASGYTGIKFWAKVGPTSARTAKVMISDQSTAPEGGVCTTTGCNDNWAKPLALTEQWKEFTIPFAALAQEGWGDPSATYAIDASQLYSIQLQFNTVPEFDLCIDDITFY
ncbi:hypothetical protein WME99_08680 [Sorangium sp. So ce136]|uniref:hypothetical protein n=1 Tax=Sorangium sp. So ce136 TaxID=3133284 RepID=UPI003F0B3447